jgi:hypothetical protein
VSSHSPKTLSGTEYSRLSVIVSASVTVGGWVQCAHEGWHPALDTASRGRHQGHAMHGVRVQGCPHSHAVCRRQQSYPRPHRPHRTARRRHGRFVTHPVFRSCAWPALLCVAAVNPALSLSFVATGILAARMPNLGLTHSTSPVLIRPTDSPPQRLSAVAGATCWRACSRRPCDAGCMRVWRGGGAAKMPTGGPRA